MARTRLKWIPIKKLVFAAASEMGHTLNPFEANRRTPNVQTAMCDICGGACWVQYNSVRGYTGGGRAAKYKCGTPEAMGLLSQEVIS